MWIVEDAPPIVSVLLICDIIFLASFSSLHMTVCVRERLLYGISRCLWHNNDMLVF